MFAIYSHIENIPNIHQIHKSEIYAQQSLLDVVSSYISQKRNMKELPLTISLDEIKLDTFPEYPVQTYFKIDENMIEIYQHEIVDKIEKGWVWNGISKRIESKKIGVFQILRVLEPMITEESLFMGQMEEMIQHIIDDIEEANKDLNNDIEEVKKLQSDIRSRLETPTILSYDDKPIDIPYLKIEYPHQTSTTACSMDMRLTPNVICCEQDSLGKGYDVDYQKTKLLEFEEKYLQYPDESSDDENKSEEEKIPEPVSDEKNMTIHKCRSSRRGIRYGRSHYNSRRMRLRAY